MSLRQVILDTETTGLRFDEGHRVIEIGCVELIDRKLTGKHLQLYINPEREIDEGAIAIHGITNEFLKDKPLFSHVVDDFMNFVKGAELVIHNAPFDVGFLDNELMVSSKHWKKLASYCSIVDTLQIARRLHVGQRNNLDALCKRYYVDNSKRDYHGALLDAHLLAHVYLAMTGGQGSFFDTITNNQTENPKNLTTEEIIPVAKHHLVVLQADADEMREHEKYLELLSSKGKCLWVD